MLKCFWPDGINKDQIVYIDKAHQFANLYYIYNALAIRRRLDLNIDLRTELGKGLNVPPNPPQITRKNLTDALKQISKTNSLTMSFLGTLDDGTENFAKEAFNLLYTECPSTERLWTKATVSTKQAFLKELRAFVSNDKTGKA